MPRVRIKPGCSHTGKNEKGVRTTYTAGDDYVASRSEMRAFGDKFVDLDAAEAEFSARSAGGDKAPSDEGDPDGQDLSSMTKDNLLAMAEDLGIEDVKASEKKDDIIAKIEAAIESMD